MARWHRCSMLDSMCDGEFVCVCVFLCLAYDGSQRYKLHTVRALNSIIVVCHQLRNFDNYINAHEMFLLTVQFYMQWIAPTNHQPVCSFVWVGLFVCYIFFPVRISLLLCAWSYAFANFHFEAFKTHATCRHSIWFTTLKIIPKRKMSRERERREKMHETKIFN